MGHTASDTDTPRQICFIATVQMQGTEEVAAEFFFAVYSEKKKKFTNFHRCFRHSKQKVAYLKRDKRLFWQG